MRSHQMTVMLCLSLSSIWLVHGKPNSATLLAPYHPHRGTETTDTSPPPGHVLETDLLMSPPLVQTQLSTEEMGRIEVMRQKRTPSGFSARGFHEGVFDRDFGHFSPVKRTQKRRPEADASGFYGDTFSNGFGEFETMKRNGGYLNENDIQRLLKRTEMGANGFDSDTFTQGFGNFGTMKKRLADWTDSGISKRKPEMTKSGFHGDVFNNGFGEFHPM